MQRQNVYTSFIQMWALHSYIQAGRQALRYMNPSVSLLRDRSSTLRTPP
jgi:hypothetical protein